MTSSKDVELIMQLQSILDALMPDDRKLRVIQTLLSSYQGDPE